MVFNVLILKKSNFSWGSFSRIKNNEASTPGYHLMSQECWCWRLTTICGLISDKGCKFLREFMWISDFWGISEPMDLSEIVYEILWNISPLVISLCRTTDILMQSVLWPGLARHCIYHKCFAYIVCFRKLEVTGDCGIQETHFQKTKYWSL